MPKQKGKMCTESWVMRLWKFAEKDLDWAFLLELNSLPTSSTNNRKELSNSLHFAKGVPIFSHVKQRGKFIDQSLSWYKLPGFINYKCRGDDTQQKTQFVMMNLKEAWVHLSMASTWRHSLYEKKKAKHTPKTVIHYNIRHGWGHGSENVRIRTSTHLTTPHKTMKKPDKNYQKTFSKLYKLTNDL